MSPKPVVRIHLLDRTIPILVILLVGLQVFAPYRGWRILLVGVGGAWLLSYIWAASLARHTSLNRELRYGFAQVGDQLEERFTLNNTGFFPLIWAEVHDYSNFPGYTSNQVRGVGSHSSIRWQLTTVCNRRGMYELGPTTLYLGDPLGLYNIEIQYPVTSSILVTPPVLSLPTIRIASGGRSGHGRPRPNAPDRTVTASSLREYSPGDSLRWIHWPTTARKGSPYVRLFDGTPAGDWWILLDAEAGIQLGEGADSTLEESVILAASLADSGLTSGIPVSLVATGDPPVWLASSKSGSQRLEILRALALLKPGHQSLRQSLVRMQPLLQSQASLVLITPDAKGDWIDALVPLVWRGIVPTVLLLDPRSYGGDQTTGPTTALLADLQIAHYVITRELLDVPEARPGRAGSWEWYVTATGKAVPLRQPENMAWRRML